MRSKPTTVIAATLLLLCFSNVSFGQAPNMGTAAGYVLFSTVGAVSNAGISELIGNVGSNSGATTGFAALNGAVHNADAASLQCSTDLLAGYNQLNSAGPAIPLAVLLGNGQVLTAGVYAIPAATSLNADLTLDGQGDASSVFIFQIQGAFSTAASSKVNLINGALACNVYWKVEGAVSMAAQSTMRGTIVANNAAISLTPGDTLEGSALSTTGAIAVDGVWAYSCGFALLPVGLLSFTGACDMQKVTLKWSTVTETNSNYFAIERSADGINWQEIGAVNGADSSAFVRGYTLIDPQPEKTISYYRLRQTGINGNYKYSDIVAVKQCGDNGSENVTVYPNPSAGKFGLSFTGNKSNVSSIEICNSLGEKVYNANGFQSEIDLSGKASGVYYVLVRLHSKTVNLKLVVEK